MKVPVSCDGKRSSRKTRYRLRFNAGLSGMATSSPSCVSIFNNSPGDNGKAESGGNGSFQRLRTANPNQTSVERMFSNLALNAFRVGNNQPRPDQRIHSIEFAKDAWQQERCNGCAGAAEHRTAHFTSHFGKASTALVKLGFLATA